MFSSASESSLSSSMGIDRTFCSSCMGGLLNILIMYLSKYCGIISFALLILSKRPTRAKRLSYLLSFSIMAGKMNLRIYSWVSGERKKDILLLSIRELRALK